MTTVLRPFAGLLVSAKAIPPASGNALTYRASPVVSRDYNRMGLASALSGSKGRVDGTVKEHSAPIDLPLARMTYLHRQRDGRRVGASLSDPNTGAYTFINIDPAEKYFVLAFDHTLNYNAVVKSDVTPDIMT